MATKNFATNLKIGAAMSSSVGRVFGALKTKIKDQEATLKGLRAEYKLAAKGTGEYAGRLDELKGKIDQAERSLKSLRKAANFDIGAGLKGIGSALGKDLKRGAVVGGVLSAGAIGIAKSWLDTTAAFEKALTVLKTIEGTEAKAQKSFGWIQDFAARTPYELQNVLDSFVKLRAYGIDPIRGDTLRILGDTASAMGKDVNDAVEAMADAVTGENERLKEFGIKAAKAGSKITYEYTDRAGKQQRKSVDANNRKMIQSTLLAIFNSKYKGAMDDQSKTWNGMVSNMKDAWARFGYEVMTSGPFQELKAQLGQTLKQIEIWSKDGTLKRWAADTGKFMVDAGKKIWEVGSAIYRGLKATADFLGGWDRLGIALVALNFAPTIVAVGQLAKGMWALTGATWAAVGPWAALAATVGGVYWVFQDLGDGDWQKGISKSIDIIGKEFEVLGRWIGNFFGRNIEALGGIINEASNAIGRNIEALMQIIDEFFTGIATKAGEAVNAIKGAFTGVFAWLGAEFDALGNKITGMWDRAKSLGNSIRGFFGGGDTPKGALKGPALAPAGALPPVDRSTSQNNNFNIRIDAPGADGRRIADELRGELKRKPLFDYDGALVPG